MKIWGDIPEVGKVYNGNKRIRKAQHTEKPEGAAKDALSISNRAKDLQVVQKALKQLPDIREEKVKELAEKYSSGSYNPSGKEIADKIVKSVFDKKV